MGTQHGQCKKTFPSQSLNFSRIKNSLMLTFCSEKHTRNIKRELVSKTRRLQQFQPVNYQHTVTLCDTVVYYLDPLTPGK